jgi:hypothetical protein
VNKEGQKQKKTKIKRRIRRTEMLVVTVRGGGGFDQFLDE